MQYTKIYMCIVCMCKSGLREQKYNLTCPSAKAGLPIRALKTTTCCGLPVFRSIKYTIAIPYMNSYHHTLQFLSLHFRG